MPRCARVLRWPGRPQWRRRNVPGRWRHRDLRPRVYKWSCSPGSMSCTVAGDTARDAAGHVPTAVASKTRCQMPVRPARKGLSNVRKDGCAPAIAACVSAAADRRAASASRSLTTRRLTPPCHNGSAICAAAAAAMSSLAPKSPPAAGSMCSNERRRVHRPLQAAPAPRRCAKRGTTVATVSGVLS
jgi:hypothetical protein